MERENPGLRSWFDVRSQRVSRERMTSRFLLWMSTVCRDRLLGEEQVRNGGCSLYVEEGMLSLNIAF